MTNAMKKLIRLLAWVVLPCVFLMNCGGDDDITPAGYEYEFINQDLQGKINGQSWSYVDGVAEEDWVDASQERFEIGAEEMTDPCNEFVDGLRVLFSTPSAVGIYELRPIGHDDGSYLVNLFDPAETLNIFAGQGAIEILTLTDTEVTGRMDVYFDDDTHVNGNFTLPYCADD